MTAVKEAILSGNYQGLSEILVGSRIWVDSPVREFGGVRMSAMIQGPFRVLSFKSFFPADPPGPEQKRAKHLVQIYTDPGGLRTLSVGSILFQDPRKQR